MIINNLECFIQNGDTYLSYITGNYIAPNIWFDRFFTSLILPLFVLGTKSCQAMGDESDLVFVLVIAGMFLTISMVFYFCDSKFRSSYYFDGDESTGADFEMGTKVVV